MLSLRLFLSECENDQIVLLIIHSNPTFADLLVSLITLHWLTTLFNVLSNDVQLDPGPHVQNNFNFVTLNVNSIVKDNFELVRLIEAHNSIFNYNLISICETRVLA